MDTLEPRLDLTIIPAVNSDGTTTPYPLAIQGAALNPMDPGFLYIYANDLECVYKVNITTGECIYVLSDKVYHTHEAEAEGLAFWDLTSDGLGQMHMFGNFMQVKEKAVHGYEYIKK